MMKLLKKTRNSKKLSPRSRLLRERANMSFFIVIIFFAVFGVIVLTEIFLIDERGRGQGVLVARGAQGVRHRGMVDRPDYEDQALLQGDDYLIYRGAGFDDNFGVFVREDRGDTHAAARAPPAGGPFPMKLQDTVRAIPEAIEKMGRDLPPGIESRLPPISSNITARDGIWQTVSGTRYKFFVFSAYFDRRESRFVRVVGATKTRGHDPVWCRLWYDGNATTPAHSVSVAAKVKVIRENWNLKYSACFVLCPLRKDATAPQSVSVVTRLRAQPANHLIVRNGEVEPKNVTIPEKVAVCVKPLHFHYNQVVQMLEFLELNSMLGVEHFTLYNHTLGPAVSCVLSDYVRRGTVTLLPWKLNMLSQKEIRTEGLFAALNDCLYRNMYRYSHVALIDLDEYIIPRHNDTLLQLVKWMGTRVNTRTTGSYSFQNAFFYLQWADDVTASAITGPDAPITSGLVTLSKTRRRAKLHPHKQRSKYLCKPEHVVEAGNHFVWEYVAGHGTLNVPPDAAVLHHYRVCEFGGDDCVKSQSVVDRTAYRYKDKLSERVTARWKELEKQCELVKPVKKPKEVNKSKEKAKSNRTIVDTKRWPR